MNLGDILQRDQIVTDLRASNRWEAIDELIDNLVVTGKIKPEQSPISRGCGQEARKLNEYRDRVWNRHSPRFDRFDL